MMFSTKPKTSFRISMSKRTTRDLVVIALFASLGIATKSLVQPMVATVTGPLYIPTGAVAGGFYMMWPVMGYGFTRKFGTATLISLVQAFFSLLIPIGNFGLFTFVIYLAPGFVIDGFFLLSRSKAFSSASCVGAAAIANVAGTISYCALFLALPEAVLLFFGLIAALSGCIGGFIASIALSRAGTMVLGQNAG